MRRPRPALAWPVAALLVATAVSGCDAAAGSDGEDAAPVTGAHGSLYLPSLGSQGPARSSASAPACSAVVSSMTREQRVGQLLMVGLDSAWSTDHDDPTITRHAVGGVVLLGGWGSNRRVTRTTGHLRDVGTAASGHGIGPFVAADQEGGTVEQLSGLPSIPSAARQGLRDPGSITSLGRLTGTRLKAVGVNLDLAPVADTVPAEVGSANAPVGRWGRQYGNDPVTVSSGVVAFTTGLRQAGVGATVKHFPGIGRLRNNTDLTPFGIDDPQLTADDPFLQPFVDGWRKGAIVMVSSGWYPQLDGDDQAVFSRKIITDLLRRRLGYAGVVVTDDMGKAQAVRDVPPGQRAVRFVAAGGDVVLTAVPSDIRPMAGALLDWAETDPVFAQRVDDAATRVLAYKATLGLAGCR